jgi:hypothetical protein
MGRNPMKEENELVEQRQPCADKNEISNLRDA